MFYGLGFGRGVRLIDELGERLDWSGIVLCRGNATLNFLTVFTIL